jgi:hypothetical protein
MEVPMTDLTPDDEALLERARRAGEATAADQARVKRKIFAQIGVGLGTSAISTSGGAAGLGGGAATGTSFVASTAKIVVALALGAGAGTGVLLASHGRDAQGTGPALRAAPATSIAAPAPSPPVETPMAASASPRESTPDESLAPTPPRAVAPGRATRTPSPAPAGERSTEATAAENTPPAAPFAAPPQPEPGGPSTVGAEADLLRQADGALKAGHPSQALALLHEHATRFPNGILSEEREAECIVVLCALGRTEEARASASQFLREHPKSPLGRRIRESCGGT